MNSRQGLLDLIILDPLPPVSIASANVSISLTPHPPSVRKCQHLKDPPLPPSALTSYVHGPLQLQYTSKTTAEIHMCSQVLHAD